jgi:uncharacterized protein YegP (UPF0339 family)
VKRAKYEVYRAKDGWRWRIKSANGRIIAQGESHTRERDADRALATVFKTVMGMFR